MSRRRKIGEPSEQEFTNQVMQLAKLRGWRAIHFRAGMNQRGQWMTPLQGNPGFPDILMLRRGRQIVAELKVGDNVPEADQALWLKDFGEVPGVEWFVWNPKDFAQIERTLE